MTAPRHKSPEAKLILQALEDGTAMDKYDIAALLGVHHRTAGRYIKALREKKKLYVFAWKQNGNGPYHPVVKLGSIADKPKPGHHEMLARKRTYRGLRNNPYKALLGV